MCSRPADTQRPAPAGAVERSNLRREPRIVIWSSDFLLALSGGQVGRAKSTQLVRSGLAALPGSRRPPTSTKHRAKTSCRWIIWTRALTAALPDIQRAFQTRRQAARCRWIQLGSSSSRNHKRCWANESGALVPFCPRAGTKVGGCLGTLRWFFRLRRAKTRAWDFEQGAQQDVWYERAH